MHHQEVPKIVCRQCPRASIQQYTWIWCYHCTHENSECRYTDEQIRAIAETSTLPWVAED